MIRWCAYCQTYLGEGPPFDDYSVTHTICKRCFDRRVFREGDDLRARVAPIARFYEKVGSVSTSPVASPEELLDEGLGLGLRPFDLLLGVLQPALYEVGDRWARAEIAYEDEHRLTAACASIIAGLEARHPEMAELRDASTPEVLLAGLGANTHTVGLQIVEFFLLAHGVRVLFLRGASADVLVRRVCSTRPKLVGLGVTMTEHVGAAVSVADRIADEMGDERPIVLLGGAAIRAGAAPPRGSTARICADFRDILGLLGREPARREPDA